MPVLDLTPFRTHLLEHDRSPHTVTNYLADLRRFAAWFDETNHEPLASPADVSALDIAAYKDSMRRMGDRPASINRRLAALRCFFKWCVASGTITSDPTAGVRDKRTVLLAPRGLDAEDVDALLDAASEAILEADDKRTGPEMTPTSREARRNLAILVTLLGTGLRLSELTALRLGDIENGSGGRRVLVVRSGKEDKERRVPVSEDVAEALDGWLRVRPSGSPAKPGTDHDQVFSGRRKQLGSVGVQRILAKLAERAGVDDVSPHRLRHTFAKNLIDAGVTLEKVQALLGHTTIATTTRYTVPREDDLARAVAQIARGSRG